MFLTLGIVRVLKSLKRFKTLQITTFRRMDLPSCLGKRRKTPILLGSTDLAVPNLCVTFYSISNIIINVLYNYSSQFKSTERCSRVIDTPDSYSRVPGLKSRSGDRLS
jgi:hypothetical protein